MFFFYFHKKTGKEIANATTENFKCHNIDIENSRGECSDNGTNMSGHMKGVQAIIKETVPSVTYLPCAPHSLNLVDVHAARSFTVFVTLLSCIIFLEQLLRDGIYLFRAQDGPFTSFQKLEVREQML